MNNAIERLSKFTNAKLPQEIQQAIDDHYARILDIRPDCGEVWRLSKMRNGSVRSVEPYRCDSKQAYGYLSVNVRGITVLSHRIIFAFVHGLLPQGMHVDHINTIKSDNRISNLQLLTPSGNAFKKFRDQGHWRGKPLIDHQLVCEMYLRGEKWDDIEAAANANSGTITGILRENGIAVSRNPRIDQGKRERIFQLRNQGLTQSRIARALDISQGSVSLILSEKAS